MPSITELRQRLQKMFGDSMSTLSAGFMDLSAQLKAPEKFAEVSRKVDKLFHSLLDSNRSLSNEINTLIEQHEKMERQIDRLNE